MNLNLYENLKSETQESISIEKYFQYIKHGYQEHEVLKARLNGKSSDIYSEIKKDRVCVTFNFFFNKKRRNINIVKPTGVVYFDIDNPDFNPNNLDLNNILSYHKSFGGNGWCIIVKADITEDNFKEEYLNIANQIGIIDYVDKMAIKKTQCTVLSYDPNIFINKDSCLIKVEVKEKEAVRGHNNIHKHHDKEVPLFDLFDNPPGIEVKEKMKFTDADDYCPDHKGYVVFEDGVGVHKLKVPRKKIIKGNRHSFLSISANRLLMLNPDLGFKLLVNYMQSINNYCLIEPVSNIKEICQYVYHKRYDLKPNHKRKIIFNPNYKLNKKQKQSIINKEIGKMKSNKTKQEIYDIIERWDFDTNGKITQKKVQQLSSKGIRTIRKYWDEFKDYVKFLNNNYEK